MTKTLTIDGQVAVTLDENNRVFNLQFLPDDERAPVLEQASFMEGSLKLLRNGYFDFIADKNVNNPLINKKGNEYGRKI